MSTHRLEADQFVPRPLDEVFAFFARPENLAALTPPSMDFEILTPPPLPMKEGALIDYRIRMGGVAPALADPDHDLRSSPSLRGRTARRPLRSVAP